MHSGFYTFWFCILLKNATVEVYVCVMLADAIQAYTGGELTVTGPTATAQIFSTYPADYLSVWGGIADQVGFFSPPSFTNVHDS